jgi:hypothetical protein
MFKLVFWGVLLGLATIPGVLYGQEKPAPAEKSGYERLMETPGSVVLAKKYPVGDPKFAFTATVSYRIDANTTRFYTLDSGTLSIDLDKLPKLINDLEIFMVQMKAAEGKDGESVFFRFSEKFWVNFLSFVDDKGKAQQMLYFNPGRFEGQGKGTEKTLSEFIVALKAGLAKLQDLQKRG